MREGLQTTAPAKPAAVQDGHEQHGHEHSSPSQAQDGKGTDHLKLPLRDKKLVPRAKVCFHC